MKEGSQNSLTPKSIVRTCLQVHIHGQWMLPSLMRSFVGQSRIRELCPPAFHELTVDLLLPVCFNRIHADIYIYMCLFIYLFVCFIYLFTRLQLHTYVYMHICKYKYIYIYTHISSCYLTTAQLADRTEGGSVLHALSCCHSPDPSAT